MGHRCGSDPTLLWLWLWLWYRLAATALIRPLAGELPLLGCGYGPKRQKQKEVDAEEKLHAVGIGNILSSLTLNENINVNVYIEMKSLPHQKTSLLEDKSSHRREAYLKT